MTATRVRRPLSKRQTLAAWVVALAVMAVIYAAIGLRLALHPWVLWTLMVIATVSVAVSWFFRHPPNWIAFMLSFFAFSLGMDGMFIMHWYWQLAVGFVVYLTAHLIGFFLSIRITVRRELKEEHFPIRRADWYRPSPRETLRAMRSIRPATYSNRTWSHPLVYAMAMVAGLAIFVGYFIHQSALSLLGIVVFFALYFFGSRPGRPARFTVRRRRTETRHRE